MPPTSDIRTMYVVGNRYSKNDGFFWFEILQIKIIFQQKSIHAKNWQDKKDTWNSFVSFLTIYFQQENFWLLEMCPSWTTSSVNKFLIINKVSFRSPPIKLVGSEAYKMIMQQTVYNDFVMNSMRGDFCVFARVIIL